MAVTMSMLMANDTNLSEKFMSEWIPIGVEYPPEDIPVLTSDSKSMQIRILKLDGKLKYWFSDSYKGNIFQVIFWMPLPALPNCQNDEYNLKQSYICNRDDMP